MLAGVLIIIASGLIWWLSTGVVAWLAGASFLFFGAVVINGLLDQRKAPESSGSDWLPQFEKLAPPAPRPARAVDIKPSQTFQLQGDGSYSFDIVGESHYQRELAAIAGKKGETAKALECDALIVHESDNPHDKSACAVFISGKKVGHLSREDAKNQVAFRKSPGFTLQAKAMIVGGWKSKRDEGSYGVKLDYIPTGLPASPLDREMYRFLGERVPKGLTRGEAREYESQLAATKDSRLHSWREFRDAAEYLQSPDGRADYEIKKPSLKQLRDAYSAIVAERQNEGNDDPVDDNDLFEMLVELYPDIER